MMNKLTAAYWGIAGCAFVKVSYDDCVRHVGGYYSGASYNERWDIVANYAYQRIPENLCKAVVFPVTAVVYCVATCIAKNHNGGTSSKGVDNQGH